MATSALPPMPGQEPPDISGMAGQQSPQSSPQQDMQQVLRAEVTRIHQVISQIETLSRSHPEAANEFKAASEALGKSIMKVTQQLTRGQEGPKPPVIG